MDKMLIVGSIAFGILVVFYYIHRKYGQENPEILGKVYNDFEVKGEGIEMPKMEENPDSVLVTDGIGKLKWVKPVEHVWYMIDTVCPNGVIHIVEEKYQETWTENDHWVYLGEL